MNHTNAHRAERTLAALSASRMEIPAEKENSPPLPTEGIKGITEIIGKAVEMTANLATAMKSSPIQLGNVVVGNNATTPQPRQQIPDLNAYQLARIETALNRVAPPAPSRANGAEIGTPAPTVSQPSARGTSNPPPAAQSSDTTERARIVKSYKLKELEPAKFEDSQPYAYGTLEPARMRELNMTKKTANVTPQPDAKLNAGETMEKATREWEEPAKVDIKPASAFEIETNVPDIVIKQE